MSQMLISVIIPTFNRAHVLRRALCSALSQTVPAHEVIVVDDGSVDGTQELVRGFPRVRLIEQGFNRGAAAARNRGMAAASGNYVAFLDSDDVWLPQKLETQRELVVQHGLDVVTSGVWLQAGQRRVRHFSFPHVEGRRHWTIGQLQSYPCGTSTWLARKAVLLDAQGFDESLPNAEDLDLLARILPSADFGHATEALTIKYELADSLDAHPEKRLASYTILLQRHQELWQRDSKAAARNYQKVADIMISSGDRLGARRALRCAVASQPWRIALRFWAFIAVVAPRHYTSLRQHYLVFRQWGENENT